MWQNGLQSALEITKCGWVDYKVRQELQSVAGIQSELVHPINFFNSTEIRLMQKESKYDSLFFVYIMLSSEIRV